VIAEWTRSRRALKALERIAIAQERLAVVAEAQLALTRVERGYTRIETPDVPPEDVTEACECLNLFGRAKPGCDECGGTGRVAEEWVSLSSDATSAAQERDNGR
jgi:hypothetical protein